MSFQRTLFVFFHLVAISAAAHAAQIKTFGKLEIASDDNTFSARITGRVHVDANFYTGGADNKRLTSGSFVRRARLGVQGNFHQYEYAFESDFGADANELKDAFLRRLVGPGKITVGQFKVFEGLERITSSDDITFIERSYVSEALPGFQIGAAYHGAKGLVGYAGTVYNMRAASDGEARPTNSGLGTVVRGYIFPVNERQMAVHVGASYAHEFTDTDGKRTRFSPAGRAEEYRTTNIDYRFVLFDRRDDHVQVDRVIFEGAAINGSLSIQGEYLAGSARDNNRAADDFNAWYVQVGYVLTGEWRRYRSLTGEIARLQPSRDSGAWEVGARLQGAERETVRDAVITATDFGLTYYANANVRFLLNYTTVDNKLDENSPDLISVRSQFDF